MTVAFIGIDLAKNVFQLHGASADGQAILKRRIRREGLLAEIAELEPCIIAVEACTGAFYWQRQFEALGHTVKVIAPQYVSKRWGGRPPGGTAVCKTLRQASEKRSE